MTNCPFWKCCRHELNIWNFSNPSWAQPVAEYPTIRRLAVTKDPEGPEPGVRTRSWPSSHFICSWTLARSCPCLGLSLPLCQKTGFGSIISFCPFLLPTPYAPALVPKPCLLCRAQFPAGNEKLERRGDGSPGRRVGGGRCVPSLAELLWLAAGELNQVTSV